MDAWGLLRGAMATGLVVLPLTFAPTSGADLDIEQGFQVVHGLDQTLSLTKPAGQLSAADLRPVAARRDQVFRYVYRLGASDGQWAPPLALDYADDETGDLAFGWTLRLRLGRGEAAPALPILGPAIALAEREGRASVSWNLEEFPASPGTFEGLSAWLVDVPGPDAQRLVFVRSSSHGLLAPIALLASDGLAIRFGYRAQAGQLVLESLRRGDRELRVERAGDGALARLTLTDGPGGAVASEWRFGYGMSGTTRLLEDIAIAASGAGVRRLRFAYGGTGAGEARAARNAPSGLWQRVDGDPRWCTPGGLTMRVAPGLRFIDLNGDSRLDMVLGDGRGRTWLSERAGWREVTSSFRPPVPLVNGSEPLGAQFINFPKQYVDGRRVTSAFPALLVSRYGPDRNDPTRLAFESKVCFPPVKNGTLQKASDPADWDCDCAKPLQLPVPLQFEGTSWPTHLPGIAAVERRENQGARIVGFDLEGGRKPQLFYVGLRYRDAVSGRVLLAGEGQAPFRDTGNCIERYEIDFEQRGLKRRVKVDTCQAFWRVERGSWRERDSDTPVCQRGERGSFWRRMDLDAEGRPNGKFILPWQDDRRYHYHYEHFRSVSFPRLKPSDDRYAAFALVQGRGGGTVPSDQRPAVRDLFGLSKRDGRWEALPRSAPYYPPDPFFETFEGQFLDLDGDGSDDAVVARGDRRRVYLNRLEDPAGPRWVERVDYTVPRACDLGSGNCQAVDLDADGDLDLMVGDGRVVFLNRSRELGLGGRRHMISATGPDGRLVPLTGHPPSRTPSTGLGGLATGASCSPDARRAPGNPGRAPKYSDRPPAAVE